MLRSADIPYWRLSSFYFFYFSFLGVWVPFWNLYLEQELAFSASAIGLLTAVVLGTKIIGPYLWGWLADHYGNRMQIIRMGSLIAFVSFIGVFWYTDFFGILVVVTVYSFFWNAVLSQFEVVTLSHLKEKSYRYAHVRLWGSVGFMIAVFGLGIAFDVFSLKYLPHILLFLLAGIWLCSLFVEEAADHKDNTKSETVHSSFALFVTQLKKPEIVVFFIACFLIQFSHGPYYTFYSIYLEQLGYQRTTIGALWSVGVGSEILLFVVMHKLFVRYSLQTLLIATLIITALRWFLIAGFAEYFSALLFAQLLHAASFGSFHAVAIEMVRRYFKSGNVGQGQAFYSAVSFGAGGSLGALLSGALWHLGANILFAAAGIAVLLGLIIVLMNLKKTDAVP